MNLSKNTFTIGRLKNPRAIPVPVPAEPGLRRQHAMADAGEEFNGFVLRLLVAAVFASFWFSAANNP